MNLASVTQWPSQGLNWLQHGKPAMVTVIITTVALAALAMSAIALLFTASAAVLGILIGASVVVLTSFAIHGLQLFSEYIPNQFHVLTGDLKPEEAIPVPDHAKSLLGRIFRISVFQFGAGGRCFENFLINRWRQHLFDHSFFSCKDNYTGERAEKARIEYREIFQESDFHLEPVESTLDGIYMNAALLKLEIEARGGSWERRDHSFVIVPPTVVKGEWTAFYQLLQKRMGWKEETVGGAQVLITAKSVDGVLDIGDPNRKLRCMLMLDIHSPYVLNKSYIAHCLGYGIDVCAYDAKRHVSEAGMYEDADAVVEWLKGQRVNPAEVCVTGSCGDTFLGMHLIQKYADQGLGAFLENPPLSIREVSSRQGLIPSWVTQNYMDAVQAPKNSELDREVEDGFDSMTKAKAITGGDGLILIAATQGDEMTPPEKVEELYEKLHGKMAGTEYILSDPNESDTDKKLSDPHMMTPHLNPKVWRKFLEHFGLTNV
jgi:hypothetical protein